VPRPPPTCAAGRMRLASLQQRMAYIRLSRSSVLRAARPGDAIMAEHLLPVPLTERTVHLPASKRSTILTDCSPLGPRYWFSRGVRNGSVLVGTRHASHSFAEPAH
jgi:hypothetical protein